MERKSTVIIYLLLVMLLPINVNATGGGLRKNSLKTCPNGITYGMHSDGHGGTHWHVAVTNENNYFADGDAIYSDPCPGYDKNQGTAGSTDGNNNTSTNNSVNNNSVQSNSGKESILEKSKDNSLKRIIIDDEEIEISDNMRFETNKKKVSIEIETTDLNAKVNYENKDLISGENIISIIVTAENGDKKDYTLTINKIKSKGSAVIKNFVLGAGEVDFRDNKATITKLKNESSLDYSYVLSDENAKLIIYLNGKETTEFKLLKENDIIKLVVVDENDNENVYEITVKNASIIYSFLIYGLIALIMLSPIVIIMVIIKKRKRNYS